jgi:hypothetical protein
MAPLNLVQQLLQPQLLQRLPLVQPLTQQLLLLGMVKLVKVLCEAEVGEAGEVRNKAEVGEAEVRKAKAGEAAAMLMLLLDAVGLGEVLVVDKKALLLCQDEAAGSDWCSTILSRSKP